jgi:hypothetical protein
MSVIISNKLYESTRENYFKPVVKLGVCKIASPKHKFIIFKTFRSFEMFKLPGAQNVNGVNIHFYFC